MTIDRVILMQASRFFDLFVALCNHMVGVTLWDTCTKQATVADLAALRMTSPPLQERLARHLPESCCLSACHGVLVYSRDTSDQKSMIPKQVFHQCRISTFFPHLHIDFTSAPRVLYNYFQAKRKEYQVFWAFQGLLQTKQK